MTEPAAPLTPKEMELQLARRLLDPGASFTRHERERLALEHLPGLLATLDQVRAEPPSLRAALGKVETIYIDYAHPPIAHDWCRLCKGSNRTAGEPIDHYDDCPIAILRAALRATD